MIAKLLPFILSLLGVAILLILPGFELRKEVKKRPIISIVSVVIGVIVFYPTAKSIITVAITSIYVILCDVGVKASCNPTDVLYVDSKSIAANETVQPEVRVDWPVRSDARESWRVLRDIPEDETHAYTELPATSDRPQRPGPTLHQFYRRLDVDPSKFSDDQKNEALESVSGKLIRRYSGVDPVEPGLNLQGDQKYEVESLLNKIGVVSYPNIGSGNIFDEDYIAVSACDGAYTDLELYALLAYLGINPDGILIQEDRNGASCNDNSNEAKEKNEKHLHSIAIVHNQAY